MGSEFAAEAERAAPARVCEDCGEEMPADERRWRCPRCGLLVCAWCQNHVHELAIAVKPADATGWIVPAKGGGNP
jgi:predicted RNA-binding Zn-ribbon protein involved in translation (DUF1610 family)